jgi:flagellar motor component MotA
MVVFIGGIGATKLTEKEQLIKKFNSLMKKYFATEKKRDKVYNSDIRQYYKLDEDMDNIQIQLSKLSSEIEKFS